MRMRRLGDSGLFVSELCFGAMTFGGEDGLWGQVGQLGQDEADALVKTALDLGVNLFDTANVYAAGRSEQILGRALENLGVARDDVVVATKVVSAMGKGENRRGGSRRHILSECRASLKRLGVEHIDLYQLHAFDPATPIEETLEALDHLVQAGDVRYVGLSNWAAWQIMKALGIGRARNLAPVISLQAYYSLAGRDIEREIIPMLSSERVGLMVWSPLAGGYLSGKYAPGGEGGRRSGLDFPPIDRPRADAVVATLTRVGAKHCRSPAEVALAWLLAQPSISTVIVGARRADQLRENARAVSLSLDADDMTALGEVSRLPEEYPGWLLKQTDDRLQ